MPTRANCSIGSMQSRAGDIMRRLMTLLTAMLLIVTGLMPTVRAEVQTYEGVGFYNMLSDFETIEEARLKAKKYAERDVLEQVKLYVASESEVRNFRLTKDEIVVIAAGIMNVRAVRYNIIKDGERIKVKCTLTATVDGDEIPEFLERERKARLG